MSVEGIVDIDGHLTADAFHANDTTSLSSL